MIRPLAIFVAGTALVAAAANSAGESFPVVHNEPVTVRILGGKDGRPLGRLHLILIAGYDQRDLREQLYREEVLTDSDGQARLPNQLASLPWLQVWVGKKQLCHAHPRRASFSVERIRRDGLSAPNRCGKATVEDAPGVFTVFVKGKGAPRAAVPVPAIAPDPTQAQASAPAGSAAAPCCCAGSKKPRRAGSACRRLAILLPGLALSLR
jgi:hypothetical protein